MVCATVDCLLEAVDDGSMRLPVQPVTAVACKRHNPIGARSGWYCLRRRWSPRPGHSRSLSVGVQRVSLAVEMRPGSGVRRWYCAMSQTLETEPKPPRCRRKGGTEIVAGKPGKFVNTPE